MQPPPDRRQAPSNTLKSLPLLPLRYDGTLVGLWTVNPTSAERQPASPSRFEEPPRTARAVTHRNGSRSLPPPRRGLPRPIGLLFGQRDGTVSHSSRGSRTRCARGPWARGTGNSGSVEVDISPAGHHPARQQCCQYPRGIRRFRCRRRHARPSVGHHRGHGGDDLYGLSSSARSCPRP